MIQAKLETRYFTFEAYGKDHADALNALRRGWDEVHKGKHYPDADSFDDYVTDGDVSYTRIGMGFCYRDGEILQ